jgi:hypothetical protein
MLRNPCWPWIAAAVLGGVCAAAGVAAKHQACISFPTQVRLGNIFAAGERVALEVAVRSGATVEWSVSDFEGRKVASGTAPVVDGKAAIAPGADGKGFYPVQLTARDGQKVTGQAVTSYAVVAPMDSEAPADTRFGVAGQYSKTMSTDTLALLAKAGVAHLRDDIPWGQVEKVKGSFDFARCDRFMAAIGKAGMVPCPVTAFGNKHYDAQPRVPNYKAAPYTPQGRAAYAEYCLAVLRHYGRQVKALEIWNEYNGSFCGGKPADDRPAHYTRMLKAAYEKIKAARPDVAVVGGAMVKVPLPYCEKLFKEGALSYMDGIAVHPYMPQPEGVEEEIAALVALTKKHNRGKVKPIWVTECGTWADRSVERAHAAGYLVRMYCLLLTQPAVRHIDWFLACDYAGFKNRGLLHGEKDPMGRFTPVALYPAYANLAQLLGHAEFVRREPTDPRTRVYRFEKDRQAVWVCWSTFESTRLIFEARGPVELVNLVGGGQAVTPADGRVALTAGEAPVYIVADKGVVAAVQEVPRPERVLADSATGFAGEQGASGWGYFYYVSNKDGSAAYQPDKVRAMTWQASPGDWAYVWAGPGQWFIVGRGDAHPSSIEGGQGWTVRRWTSDRAGPIRIRGQASRGANGDGTAVKVFLDGKELLSRMLSPKGSATIDLKADVRNGSRLRLRRDDGNPADLHGTADTSASCPF